MKILYIIFLFFASLIGFSQGSSINETGSPADSSAMLDVSATDKGILIPRLTANQRDAIQNPAHGLMIFNNDETRFEFYNDSTLRWHYFSGGELNTSSFICGNSFTDIRDGQSYATIQIGTQCWMAENLNIGARILGSNDQTDNDIIEKYCYQDVFYNCDKYGGLYQWDEIMQYMTTEGTKGICPAGWHIPTDAEWCILENEVDAGTVSCTATGFRGIDAGLNLKSLSGWNSSGGNSGNGVDLFGYTGIPGGYRLSDGSFL